MCKECGVTAYLEGSIIDILTRKHIPSPKRNYIERSR